MRLYIIRHADPDYPNKTLTPDGHLEAQALAKRMANLGLDRIYCSPKGRALHTMQYIADAINMEANILNWTAELDSLCFEATPPWHVDTAWDFPGEVFLNHKTLPTHSDWDKQAELKALNTKEVFEDLIKNSDEFLETLGFERQGTRYRVVRPNSEKVAVFTHGGFILTWLAHLLQIPLTITWAGFWLAPSSVTTILFDQRSPEWATPRCIGLGDTSHLYEAKLDIKPRGIKANFD